MSFSKETIEKFKKFEDKINLINELIVKIEKLKSDVVDRAAQRAKQKPVWNLESYLQLAIHRVYDLATESTNSWNNANPLVSFLLTRALYENTAYMYDLSKKIEKYNEEDNYLEIHKLIANRLAGTRLDLSPKQSSDQIVNVLTVIKTIAKEIPDFKNFYEFISDFCHPNYSGMLGIYGKIDKENSRLFVNRKYGYTEKTFSFIITGLATGLTIFYQNVSDLLGKIDELNEFYNRHQSLVKKVD